MADSTLGVMMSGTEHGPFVGRARELAALRARLAEARDGRGGLVLIVGEPRFTRSEIVPICLVLAGSFVWAVGNIQIKRLGAIDPFAANG